ncbi:B-4DMT family transporter [Williamsia sterculiae]|uniref:Transmembrane protein n=1 Tax=Williamsia sterculiae TaxID=1344003 RepID=A0A1N7EI26_9NOCA|nr:B-4DMT family transporter [Williamsia sterculiae]SIR87575.1 hypothetical protein SAMN05445060_1323 [Williamsia sterculiae]
MIAWLLRGLVMTGVHIAARVLLAIAVVESPLHGTAYKFFAVAVVILIALIWGGVDGILDARAHEEPDDYRDLLMRWLKAGLFTGLISAIVCYLLAQHVLAGMGDNGFFIELIAGGSFTALLVFIPAMAGVAVGRFLIRSQRRRAQKRADRDDDDRDDRDSNGEGRDERDTHSRQYSSAQ